MCALCIIICEEAKSQKVDRVVRAEPSNHGKHNDCQPFSENVTRIPRDITC